MTLANSYACAWELLPVQIHAGATLTDAINMGGLRLFGFILPSDWTNADLTFQMSPDAGATWFNMVDQKGNEILATSSGSSFIALDTPPQFAAVQHLRIRSGSSSVQVPQAQDRTLQLILRSL